MSSDWGRNIKISIFGESHGKAIGVNIGGFPAGIDLDMDFIQNEMARRRPGREFATKRSETDIPEILSGVLNGKTTGAPICAIIRNNDTRSSDYSQYENIPRPSHADYPARLRYKGFSDIRGGGHFSGRLTAPLVFAGALCKAYLETKGIAVGAHLYSIGEVFDTPFDPVNITADMLNTLYNKTFPVISDTSAEKMKTVISDAADNKDSIGGIIECAVTGITGGIGSPIYCGVENILSSILFGIPAVKGVEFGDGFGLARMYGSNANDAYRYRDGKLITETNLNGGILGGITTGMPVIFRTAIKPTPSVSKPQLTADLKTGELSELVIKGRHDPCIAVRAVAAVEAAAAVGIAELILEAGIYG